MHCAHCHHDYEEGEVYCRGCGKELPTASTSLVTTRTRLPALLPKSQLQRSVAASVGAVAFGVGLELLRRGLLTRLAKPPKTVEDTLPLVNGLKDVLLPRPEKSLKRRKRFEIEETVVYVRRVIRQ